jgi:hypothetical protein
MGDGEQGEGTGHRKERAGERCVVSHCITHLRSIEAHHEHWWRPGDHLGAPQLRPPLDLTTRTHKSVVSPCP